MTSEPVAPSRLPGWAGDLLGALTVAALLLPEAVAYARIGGLPPAAGLVALFTGLLAYGLVGASPVAIVAATSSSAAVLAASIASEGVADPAARIALSSALVTGAGVLFVIASIARLGAVSSFISRPVLRGFAMGLAWTIILRQLAAMAGVALGPPTTFLANARTIAGHAGHWNHAALAAGAVALAGLWLATRWRRFPAALLVLALGIAWGHGGYATAYGVPLAGPIDLAGVGLPALPSLPMEAWERTAQLAFAVALILYAESYTAIRTFSPGHATSPDRDLMALGLANLASGLLRGLPVGAGFSATAANASAGATRRLGGLLAAGLAALAVALLLPFIEETPEPVLAAVVVHALRHAADPRRLSPFFAWHRDRLVVVAAAVAVLSLGVLQGLLLGIAVSLAMTLRQLSQPRVAWLARLGDGSHDFVDADRHPQARAERGLLVARPEEPLFFANAERVFDVMRRRLAEAEGMGRVRGFVLSLEASSDLDSASLEALADFAAELAHRRVAFRIARARDLVRDGIALVDSPSLYPKVFEPWSVDDAVADLLEG